jgi:hypothetical protein
MGVQIVNELKMLHKSTTEAYTPIETTGKSATALNALRIAG